MDRSPPMPGRPGLLGGRREWTRELAVAAAAGVFLGLTGPFGSYLNQSRPIVLAYWIGTVLFGAVVFGLTLRPAVRFACRRRLPVAPALAVATILACVPLSLAYHAAAAALWPVPIGRLAWFVQTLIISAPFALLYALSERRQSDRSVDTRPRPPAPTASATDFLTRLPPGLGRDLIALEMEDHYVRAHTSAGSALVLIPLHQAIAELRAIPGLRVHRSWWVACGAMAGAIQDGRNLRLRLANGSDAPVSRANVAAVRAAGLLSRFRARGSALEHPA